MQTRRKRVRDEDREELLHANYKVVANALKKAISKTRMRSRDRLMGTLDQDPWGSIYCLVLGRIRSRTSPITESLGKEALEKVLTTLFLCRDEAGIQRTLVSGQSSEPAYRSRRKS